MSIPTGNLPAKVRKLDEEFQSMFDKVEKIEKTQQKHGEKLNRLQTDVTALKTDVATLKTDVAGLKTDMVDVKRILGVIVSRLPER